MKNLKVLFALAALGSLSACAMKTKILDANAISMTRTNLSEGQKLQEVGPVTGEFCSNAFADKGNIGLIDEAVKSAQTKYSIDFITNASFYTNGNGCISVEGTGQKIMNETASASADSLIKGKSTHKK